MNEPKQIEPLKLCINCKYMYHAQSFDDKNDDGKCTHESNVNPVDGSPTMGCYDMRWFDHYCGMKAKYFEPKENHEKTN